MNVEELKNNIENLSLSGIIRCLRSTVTSGSFTFDKSHLTPMSIDILRYYWALSDGVEEIAKSVVASPRRLITDIDFNEVELFGDISGSINAAATMIAQARTLNPSLFIVHEPFTTSHSLPNRLVAWVLSEAFQILLSARRFYKQLNSFTWFNEKVVLLEQALRNEMLHEIQLSPSSLKRPNGSVLRSASKARLPIYQKAIDVFDQLDQLERGHKESIIQCINQTLLAKLEYWQQLELATALTAAIALSAECNQPVNLAFPISSGRPVAVVGDFEIYWQYSIKHRSDENLDTGELWSRQIAQKFGFSPSDGRADVVVLYKQEIVALFECKYFESASSISQSVLDACNQIVRYARDAYPESVAKSQQLLNNSCIIVADKGPYKDKPNGEEHLSESSDEMTIRFSDINDLLNNRLSLWARNIKDTCS